MLNLLYQATIAAFKAGDEVLKHYNDYKMWQKPDSSPLTSADLAANDKIFEILNDAGIEICSEEKIIPFEKRQNLKEFWVVDPLDGTKEFIKKSGEFCTCIGLLQDDEPTLGVIFSPVSKEIIYGAKGIGIFYEKTYNDFKPKFLPLKPQISQNFTAIISKNSTQFYNIKQKFNFLSISSAIKFIYLCQNKAQIYPRFKGSCWWDICAGDALLRICGGKIIDLSTKKQLIYKGENLKNSNFIAFTKEGEKFLQNNKNLFFN